MTTNISASKAGYWDFGGDRRIARLGYGTMQLTGDFYGPHVANEILREALYPYADDLVLVTKVGAKRNSAGDWLPALSADELRGAVHDNLRRLGLDQIDAVNLRLPGLNGPEEGSLEEQFTVLAELREQGLIRHLGISNATSTQLVEALRIAPVVCVQNYYNIVRRSDEAFVRQCADQGIAYVPFFPLGGFQLIDDERVRKVAERHGATVPQIALAWLLDRSPNLLAIPGTGSLAHLEDNVAAASLRLSAEDLADLEPIADQQQ
jgi:pyridoxine 4-dehydrogenase